MNEKLNAPDPSSVSSWKYFVLRALAWGVGCGLGISVAVLSVFFYTRRPKHWDAGALLVKRAKAQALSALDDKLAEKGRGVVFTVDIENTTGADITLPQSVTIMQSARETGALHGSVLKLEREYLIPARHVVRIAIDNDDLCTATVSPQNCFDAYFKDQTEIVIFDSQEKYEVHVPIPTFTAPKDSTFRFRAE